MAQVSDVDSDDVVGLGLAFPHGIDELLARKDLPREAQKVLQQVKFRGGQVRRLAAAPCTGAGSLQQDRASGSAGMPRPISYAVSCSPAKTPPRRKAGPRCGPA